MKRIVFLILASIALAVAGYGQGSIQFLNPPTVLIRWQGTVQPVPVDINAGLYYGIFIGPSADALSDQPAGPLATGSSTAPGRMTGVPAVYLLEGTQPGQIVFAQIRAWDKRFGTDWRTARTHDSSYYLETDIRQLEPLGPSSGPGTVIWQGATGTSANRFFAMSTVPNVDVPEPNAWALLGLGALTLICRLKARKK